MNTMGFAEKEMMTDVLSSQKNIAGVYNTYAQECVCPNLMGDMLNILEDEHNIGHDVFSEMQKRGWYPTEPADQTKVNEVKQKYQGMTSF